MRRLFYIFLAGFILISFSGCIQDDPIHGSWVPDPAKSLEWIESQTDMDPQVKDYLVGYYTQNEFENNDYLLLIGESSVQISTYGSSEPVVYPIIRIAEDEYITDDEASRFILISDDLLRTESTFPFKKSESGLITIYEFLVRTGTTQ